jgi:uncharacterized protein
MIKKIVLIIATVMCMCSVAFAEVPDKPTHDIYVVDNANMLDNSTKSDILNKGKELEENTGAQFVVVTINSLDGQDIESYSNDLFNSWGIGNKDNNNGVLLVVAKNDHKYRLEIGSGLEGTLTDSLCYDLLSRDVKPKFKDSKYNEGVSTMYSDVSETIGTGEAPQKKDNTVEHALLLLIILVVTAVFIIIGLIFGDSGSGSGGGSYNSGSSFGGGCSCGGGCSGGW